MDLCSPKILSFCSGVGGLDLGIKLAFSNARTICYIERDVYPAAVLVKRMQEGVLDEAPVWTDIATFDGRKWCGIVDILTGGFPCQPWSCSGKRKRKKDDRWIWDDIERMVRQVKPSIVFLENVPGLTQGGLSVVLASLASMGFHAEWGVFSASAVGAPHKRQRLFILAVANAYCLRRGAGGKYFHCSSPKYPDGKQIFSIDSRSSKSAARKEDWPEARGLFPGRPGDYRSWKELHQVDQDIQPTVAREGDGSSKVVGQFKPETRREEIRAVGNGVVPVAVAFAFISLWTRFLGVFEGYLKDD